MGFDWVSIDFNWFYQVLGGVLLVYFWFYEVLLGFIGFHSDFMGCTEFFMGLISATPFKVDFLWLRWVERNCTGLLLGFF